MCASWGARAVVLLPRTDCGKKISTAGESNPIYPFCKFEERRLSNLSGRVVKVSGPLVVATGLADANMSDVVRVGPQRLIGEI